MTDSTPRCKKCETDLNTEKRFFKITENEETYYVCGGCYSDRCPHCGEEMEEEDPGCDEYDMTYYRLNCVKCGHYIDVTQFHDGIISVWFEQYMDDVLFSQRRI